ncbi:plasmid partitioning protein [Streptomyces sp. Ru62]|uniref:ParB/RepB/Spo0J family partition protein n=1 Tax=Streptomyces sp. Ru62 TaxID=2080745 RepID=UPI000CDD197E|nr:ParB/RepB/Spo0J family partition protein [Streptomyces sp. Ru62]POX64425.1 plasmid partitioning protein [Streptomyces sp. Ru62]
MSKADQLGAGRFGGARTVSARRQAVAAATGVPTEGVAPPTELPIHRVSPNPDNPRSRLGDLTDLAGSLKTHGQKQAITVMNRDAYLKANPDREGDLEPDTTYVVIDGSSRLAAAREAGLTTVKVMVSDDQGNTSEELLESALVANIHRQDLGELDEARALQRLLAIHGSQTALAKRLHRSQGWVSQRLALLTLTPELQARIGQEPIDLLRAVGKKPAEEQEAALEALKAERARADAERVARREAERLAREAPRPPEPEPEPEPQPVVATPAAAEEPAVPSDAAQPEPVVPATPPTPPTARPAPPAAPSAPAPAPAPVMDAAPPATVPETAVPEPRTTPGAAAPAVRPAGAEQPVRRLPYDEPGSLAMLLDQKIEDDDVFFDLIRFLGLRALQRDPVRLGELGRSLGDQSTVRAD